MDKRNDKYIKQGRVFTLVRSDQSNKKHDQKIRIKGSVEELTITWNLKLS